MTKPDPPTPTIRLYHPITAIVLTIVAFLGSQIIGALLFGAVLLLVPGFRGLSGAEMEAKVTADHWLYLALIVLIESLAITIIWIAMKRRAILLSRLGLGQFRGSYVWKAVLGYGAVVVFNIVVFACISLVFPHLDISQKQDLGVDTAATGETLLPMFIALVLIPPLVEEFIMRGFLFANLRARLSFTWSAIIVSLLFGLAHITQTDNGLFWSGAVSFFVLSMVLCYLRERTKSLWPGVGVHMLQNGIAFILLYIVKAG